MTDRHRIELDVAIVGGGIAGLWILDRLVAEGYRAALLEADALGTGQTIASQGMIHGGLKYALGGALTRASEAMAGMPSRWRACLAGHGEVDLRGVHLLAERHHLWTNEGALGRLGAFLASRVLHGRVTRLDAEHRPPVFHAPFAGSVYALEDPVVDVASLLALFAQRHRGRIGRARVAAHDLHFDGQGGLESIAIEGGEVRAATYVLAAGAGNEDLLQGRADAPPMQRRPLHQAIVRHPILPQLFGHCVSPRSPSEPRVTITTHTDATGTPVWYVGGAVATEGATRDAARQIRAVHAALRDALPWLDLSSARIEPLYVDRAEPRTRDGQRPDEPFVARVANVRVVWPTKLALVPDLADRVVGSLHPPAAATGTYALPLPAPEVALAPWR